jgi:hypothetical protein
MNMAGLGAVRGTTEDTQRQNLYAK